MGDRGIITHKHKRTILEMMKAMLGQGHNLKTQLEENLEAIRDYLATPKDTLSDDHRDYRAKTLGIWLSQWTDQLHRAQSFLDLKKRNIVKMPEQGDGVP